MAQFDVILFDIDDVLLQTSKVKWAQHKFVAKKYYDIDLTDATLGKYWGKAFPELIGLLYNHADTPENMANNFVRHELEFRKQLFPDTLDVLEKLHKTGVTMGLITSGRWEVSKIEMDLLKLPLNYFLIQQGCDESEYHKPDPRVFDPALKLLAAHGFKDLAKMVYIGDATSDVSASNAAGLGFIGVVTGQNSVADLRKAGATTVVTSLRDILPLI